MFSTSNYFSPGAPVEPNPDGLCISLFRKSGSSKSFDFSKVTVEEFCQYVTVLLKAQFNDGSENIGTGFSFTRDGALFIVTAKHVLKRGSAFIFFSFLFFLSLSTLLSVENKKSFVSTLLWTLLLF